MGISRRATPPITEASSSAQNKSQQEILRFAPCPRAGPSGGNDDDSDGDDNDGDWISEPSSSNDDDSDNDNNDSDKNSDWISFADEHHRDFNICLSCFETSISHTQHARYFERAEPRPKHIALQCDFSKNWARRAWCWIIVNPGGTSLSLLATVARVSGPEGECPNGIVPVPRPAEEIEIERLWYTIASPKDPGQLMDQFTICSFCVTNLYTILPSLAKARPFVPATDNPCAGTCDIVAHESERIGMYLWHLMAAEWDAQEQTAEVDISEFSKFVARFAHMPECRKSDLMQGKYHVMTQIPDFTVYEECFEEVVKPSLDDGTCASILVSSFAPPVTAASGFQCQLYSKRLRAIWS